jgi:basic amino acid/polyamine antiporter, APA family
MTAAMEAETPGFTMQTPAATATQPGLYVRQTSGLVRTVGPRTALFANLVGMGIIVNYFWIVFASAGYPNANLVTTVGIGVLINLGVGYVYWMLASSMPRSGGDYVFLGRIFHPSIGLGTNLLFTVVFVTWAGYFAYYTAIFGIPTTLAAYSVAGGGSNALAMANTIIGSHVDQFLIGFFVLLLVILVSLLPTKWIFRTVVGIFVISALIFIIMLGVLLTTSQATFAADWNANTANSGNYTYQALAASVAGSTSITLTGTFLGIVYTMLSFIGYANSSYYGGEIRGNPTRTQGLAIFGAPLIFAVLIAILYAASYATFGRNFLIGASLSYVTGGALTSIPSPLFLAAYILHGDPVLAGFLSFGLILTFFGFALVYFIVPTRNLFSWSFDRILPTAFATVNRNGVPWVAVIALAVASVIVLWVGVYTTLLSYLSYSNFGFWLAVGLVCLGGALFPFLRPQLFRSSPRIVQAKIGPLPIITIVGIASWLSAWFVSYAASTASYVEPSGAYSYAYLIFLPIVFVIGVVAYWISRAIQMSRGVPMDLINKELPPE